MKQYKAGYYLNGIHGLPPDPITEIGQELSAVEQAYQTIWRLRDNRYAAQQIIDRICERLRDRLRGLVMDLMGEEK